MKIEYIGESPQFLGILNNTPCIISSEKSLNITEKELSVLKKRKWFSYLANKGLIKISEKKIEQTEQIKKSKKKKEKVIQVDMD